MVQRIPRVQSGEMVGSFFNVRVARTQDMWGELLEWLNDPARPGQWTFAVEEAGAKTFWFSDEKVAIEFRVRFA